MSHVTALPRHVPLANSPEVMSSFAVVSASQLHDVEMQACDVGGLESVPQSESDVGTRP